MMEREWETQSPRRAPELLFPRTCLLPIEAGTPRFLSYSDYLLSLRPLTSHIATSPARAL